MSRHIERLTALKIQAKDLAPGMYADRAGLYLRVTPGGARNWVLRSNSYVFPGPYLGMPLSNMAFLMLLRRMGVKDLTVHGFRATF